MFRQRKIRSFHLGWFLWRDFVIQMKELNQLQEFLFGVHKMSLRYNFRDMNIWKDVKDIMQPRLWVGRENISLLSCGAIWYWGMEWIPERRQKEQVVISERRLCAGASGMKHCNEWVINLLNVTDTASVLKRKNYTPHLAGN